MKKITSSLLLITLAVSLSNCGSTAKSGSHETGDTKTTEAKKDSYKQSPSAKGKRICTNKKDVRYIEVIATDTGCAVNYTKFGTATEIARATKDMGHCDRVSEKTQVNLVESGFTCE